jgi:hypothetical protein
MSKESKAEQIAQDAANAEDTANAQQIAPYSHIIVSEKAVWQRWAIIAAVLVMIAVEIVGIQQTNENQTIGDGNRDILCAVAVDDARANAVVRVTYERLCGVLSTP